MYTGSLNEFHDAGNEYVSTVTNSIDFDFFSADISVNEYGFVFINFNGSL